MVTVQAFDGANTVTLDVTVTVTGVNEAPAFARETDTRTVDENTAEGQDIGSPSRPPNRTPATPSPTPWAVTMLHPSPSSQTQASCRPTLPLDYETKTSYTVTVTATDQSNESDTITVTITVTDVNEAPVITGQHSIDYPENGTSTVFIYTADDPEGLTVTWSLEGDDDDDLSISPTGALTFNTPPNFEEPEDADRNNEYRVTVKASDGTETGTLALTINVTNVNEPPEFPTETVTRSVAENTPPSSSIGDKVTATDPDAGYDLTYTLSGDDADSFNIVETSGELQTKAPLDREVKSAYTVTVSVTDGMDDNGNDDTTADDTITVTITVTNVNEAPVITPVDSVVTGDSSINYPENGTSTVATYEATDPEGVSVNWYLSGEDGDAFSINGGVLTFYTPPNYEAATDDNTDNEYIVIVQASDGTKTGTLTVTITVTDMNEEPEFPHTETGSRSVAENTQAGQDIGAPIAATDPESRRHTDLHHDRR